MHAAPRRARRARTAATLSTRSFSVRQQQATSSKPTPPTSTFAAVVLVRHRPVVVIVHTRARRVARVETTWRRRWAILHHRIGIPKVRRGHRSRGRTTAIAVGRRTLDWRSAWHGPRPIAAIWQTSPIGRGVVLHAVIKAPAIAWAAVVVTREHLAAGTVWRIVVGISDHRRRIASAHGRHRGAVGVGRWRPIGNVGAQHRRPGRGIATIASP
mmetsp:Transcript_78713/g.227580  ORF Transcript_78713/g.227580 Transcript_78713/m.227580 type:complete len:213 (+) Transcript_78713:123-761(+)